MPLSHCFLLFFPSPPIVWSICVLPTHRTLHMPYFRCIQDTYSCSKPYSRCDLTAHFNTIPLHSSLMKIIRINLLGHLKKADTSTLPRGDCSMWWVTQWGSSKCLPSIPFSICGCIKEEQCEESGSSVLIGFGTWILAADMCKQCVRFLVGFRPVCCLRLLSGLSASTCLVLRVRPAMHSRQRERQCLAS